MVLNNWGVVQMSVIKCRDVGAGVMLCSVPANMLIVLVDWQNVSSLASCGAYACKKQLSTCCWCHGKDVDRLFVEHMLAKTLSTCGVGRVA